ncbi:hypothetical protein CIT292_06968 [Citrobacter youngae ATCC 29220]|uniref:Uncharacterized protein n=1 Tax=Citrobacter youngae ATCC 29220 TaxID=500640 RepID=D4B930_9ENTR|nr:hypothetical protein CIT292_06968 [Citrobacter youngae ATCC 29220]
MVQTGDLQIIVKLAIYGMVFSRHIHNASSLPPRMFGKLLTPLPERTRLFQRFNGRAKIDMQHIAVDHQCRDGLHSRLFCFRNPARLLSQVNNINFNIGGQMLKQRLFCGNANRATGMIKTGFRHDTSPFEL